MSKNKIAKLLLALGLGVATAASGVAMAGCAGKCNPDDEPQQEQPKTEYTVNFDLNYTGATGAPQSQKVESGAKLTEPKGVTRPDYNLEGWYTEATGGTKWNFTQDTVTKGMTLYAHWKKDEGEPGPGPGTETETLIKLTKDNVEAFSEGEEIEGAVFEAEANKALTLLVPADAGECYLVAIPADAFTAEGQSDAEFTIKIGGDTVTYSWAGNTWGMPMDGDAEPIDFTGISSVEVTSQTNITLHIALAGEGLFDSQGPETPQYEDVVSAVDFTAQKATSSAVITEDLVMGKFTLKNPTGDTKFETSSSIDCLKWAGGLIYFTVSGEENTLTLQARSGSSSGAGITLLKVTDESAGTTESLTQWGGSVASGKWIPAEGADGVDAAEDLVYNLEKGTYALQNKNTVRISRLQLLEKLPQGNPQQINVTGATEDFVEGDEFNSNGLTAKLVYDNGREDVITPTSVDSSAVKMDTSGAYDVTVKYTYEKTGGEFTATYKVYVYKVDSIVVGSDRISTGTSSAAGNGIYFNEAMQEFYFVGDELNTDGLSVTLNCSVTGEEGKTNKFYDRSFTTEIATGSDMNTAGKKTVILTSYGKTAELTVYVAQKPDITDEVKISVDSNTADNVIGTVVDGQYKFSTIQQALDFLDMLALDINVKKTITLAAETYEEKLEITVPNLTIVGTKTSTAQSTIEYDALFGIPDPSGYIHTTDSTATLAVRDGAEGFVLDGVIVNNKFGNQKYFDDTVGKDYAEHRALAVLIMADKVIIKNSVLNGYQDTLELFKGRQIIKDTLITGLTDFIFGTNNTTYFDNCEIRTIKADRNAADRTGLTQKSAHGGYITAFKGNNKNADDAVKYGAIFVGCHFSAEDGVADGLMAIARPWGAYAKVAVIECVLDKHIATVSSGTASQDERYVTMSGTAPTTSTVEFREYKNTGEGSITEEVAGMKFLTDEEVANYKDKSVIFGTTNGKVTYDDVWTGEEIAIYTLTIKTATDETIYTESVTSGTVITKAILLSHVPLDKYPTAQTEGNEVRIKGFYTDKAGETEFVYGTAITAETTIYVIFEEIIPAKTETHTLEVPSSGSWTENTAIGSDSFFMVIANNNSKVTKIESIKNENSGYTKNGKNLEFSHQFSLTSGGIKSATTGHGIGFTIPEGKTARVTLYAAAKSDKQTVTLKIYNGSSTQDITDLQIDGQPESALGYLSYTNNSVKEYSFTIEAAGTIGIGGDGGGAYIYGMVVEIIG